MRPHVYLTAAAIVVLLDAASWTAFGQSPDAQAPTVRKAAPRDTTAPTEAPADDVAMPRYDRRSLREISLDIAIPPGTQPSDQPEAAPDAEDHAATRPSRAVEYYWTAPALAIRPTYFDDIALERYGYTAPGSLQPLISGTKFYTDILILPYKVGFEAPRRTFYTFGYDRSGSEARRVRGRLPWSARGAALQAGVVTGFGYLIP